MWPRFGLPAQATGNERGQASILLVGIIALGFTIVIVLLALGRTYVDQARAQTAADAVALATTAGPEHTNAVASWYRSRGTDVVIGPDHVTAVSGASSAQAAAEMAAASQAVTPVVAAVIARAEQLLGVNLVPVPPSSAQSGALGFELSYLDAQSFAGVAAEFGLCEDSNMGPDTAFVAFRWC